MSSNLVKGGYISLAAGNKLTIDNNEFVARRIEELTRQIKEEPAQAIEESFSDGLDPETVEALVSDGDGGDEGFVAGGIIKNEDPLNGAAYAAAMEEANERAREIVECAEQEAQEIKNRAAEDGRSEGYEQGLADARAAAEAEYRQKEDALKKKEEELTAEYQKKTAELEPLLVDKLAGIFERVCGARLENEKETVMYLLNRALTGSESGRDYIIHVTADDYQHVRSSKEELCKGTGILPENIEIVEDATLTAGGCMIESEGGIWDCSLGTQLKQLAAELRILSYN